MKFKHFVPHPKPLQPKETDQDESHFDYFVSPRKFIRYIENQGSNFTYADNFIFENIVILTQNDDNTTNVKIEFRLRILKSFFIQSILIRESESECKKTHETKFS